MTIECRAIHMRDNNRTQEDDYFNEIIHNRPDANGITIPKDELKKEYDMYSELMGFDIETGNPTRAYLEEYGLKDVADELEALSKLPA
jgi:aldehyde:ferredoxin oxidoreductase